MQRCTWANHHILETHYHDSEWGVPVYDDQTLFAMLILESAQSGLSWLTILKKREGYLRAFDNFDVAKIAHYSEYKIASLMNDESIVRNKLKIHATINNAQRCLEIQSEYGSFAEYIWSFVGAKPINNKWQSMDDVPTSSAESLAMSKDLKKKGFKFIGTTTCYAYMQGVGMVNDHLVSCFRYPKIQKLHQSLS